MDQFYPPPPIILLHDSPKFNPSIVTILCQPIKQVNGLYGDQLIRLPVSIDTAVITLLARSLLMPYCFCVPAEAPNTRDTKYQVCASMLAHNESELSEFSPFDPSFHRRGDADNETEHHH